MKTRVLARLGALLLVAGLPLAGAIAAAAAPPIGSAGRAEVGPLTVQSQVFDVPPTAEPRLLTVACPAGAEVVSGGYTVLTASQPAGVGPPNSANNDAHVVFSYPSLGGGEPAPAGGRPTAWTVGIIDAAKTVVRIQVSTACLNNADVRSSVALTTETHTENQFSLTTDCPTGTVRAGGGYRSDWNRSLGGAAITGSYPGPDQRWAIDVAMLASDPDVRPRATVTVFAVCLSGAVRLAALAPTNLVLTSGTRVCTGGDQTFAAACTVPQSGSQRAGCSTGQTLAGGGYQVAAGGLPGTYSVIANTPDDSPAWTVAVNGTTPTVFAIRLRVTAVCLVARAAATDPATVTPPDSIVVNPLLVVGGAVLVFLVLVAIALAVLAARRAARRRRATGPGPGTSRRPSPPVPGLEIIVRAQRSSYRSNGFRES